MNQRLLSIMTIAMVIESGQLMVSQRQQVQRQDRNEKKDAREKRITVPYSAVIKSLNDYEKEVRLGNRLARICHIEKKLRKAFGHRLANRTSNLLPFFELPAPPHPHPLRFPSSQMKLESPIREEYFVRRCSHNLDSRQLNVKDQLNDTLSPTVTNVEGGLTLDSSSTKSSSPGLRRHKGQPCLGVRVYISFADLGWTDWIVKPHGFFTTVCVGTCRSGNSSPTKNKCCSQSHYKSLEVLHNNSRGLLDSTILPNLVAVGCRCRRC